MVGVELETTEVIDKFGTPVGRDGQDMSDDGKVSTYPSSVYIPSFCSLWVG